MRRQSALLAACGLPLLSITGLAITGLAGCGQLLDLASYHDREGDGGESGDGGETTDAGADSGSVNDGGPTDATGDAPASMSDACTGGGCDDVGCPGAEVRCSGACVDLTSSSDNCGRCGRDCGGGACIGNQCQPETLIASIDQPTGFAVDSHGIYFAVDDAVQVCPLTGCSPVTNDVQIVTLQALSLVAGVNGSVAFVGNDPAFYGFTQALLACPITGCPDASLPPELVPVTHGQVSHNVFDALVTTGSDLVAHLTTAGGSADPNIIERCVGVSGSSCASIIGLPPVGVEGQPLKESWVGTIVPPIAADSTQVYFVLDTDDGGISISSTGIDGTCDAGVCTSVVVPGADPSAMVSFGGVLYFVAPYLLSPEICDSSQGCGPVFSCATVGCAAPSAFATLNYDTRVLDLTADSSGVYFVTGSVVDSCPLTGCGVKGPVAIASQQASPSIVRASGGFIYWVNMGTIDGDSGALLPGTASIMRIAEPL
jgi:hypothetical protein